MMWKSVSCVMWLICFLLSEISNIAEGSSHDIPFKHHIRQLSNTTNLQCPPWSYFNASEQICDHDVYYAIDYFEEFTYLRVGYCVTYDENIGVVSFAPCPYFHSGDDVILAAKNNIWYIKLPNNISALNEYMCGPLHRKGRVCSECADGYAPAVTSVGFDIQCSNCTGVWYGIPLYLFMEFVPVTIFYIIILVFQINITSAPMTCYIMYSQLVALSWSFAFDGEDYNLSRQTFILNNHTELFRKIVLSIYDVWNLRFFHYLVPPFCISSMLKPFHVGLLGYISIIYPFCLIALTWICIELHGYNFKLLVWLWKPLHKFSVKLKRKWNKKSSIIDVFASFFLLSFSKVMYQTALFISYQTIRNKQYDNLGILLGKSFVTDTDLTVTYGSSDHLLFAIPSVLFLCMFNLLPTLVLILYPCKLFHTCLSKCRLDRIISLKMKFFVDKFYSCYKDQHDGGKDMRSFAALYFILRPMMFVAGSVVSLLNVSNMNPYLPRNIILISASLLIALCRPYKETYMNVLDTLLLAHFGLFCHLVSSYQGFQIQYHASFVYSFEIVLVLPFAGFLLYLGLRCLSNTAYKGRILVCKFKCLCCCNDIMNQRMNSAKRSDSLSSEQPLVEPVHVREISDSYGAIN